MPGKATKEKCMHCNKVAATKELLACKVCSQCCHFKCIGITDASYREINAIEGGFWCCETCVVVLNSGIFEALFDKIKIIDDKLNEMKEDNNDRYTKNPNSTEFTLHHNRKFIRSAKKINPANTARPLYSGVLQKDVKVVYEANKVCELRAAPKPVEKSVLYLGRMSPDIDDAQILNYLKKNGISAIKIYPVINKNIENILAKSFKIIIKKTDYSKIISDPMLWPEGTVIRDWIFNQSDSQTIRSQNNNLFKTTDTNPNVLLTNKTPSSKEVVEQIVQSEDLSSAQQLNDERERFEKIAITNN
ncbi:hypothetical protein HELRODRAFT_178508 [Helobdella robusta]|uniref:Zinc finger PHD-type domain-containing protein n=1 Tax=Helobdella robusta TaxID=6412 RepID=T1FDA1_HELRO|nr:hypothetical protein HELRODRAFT_178508 [Helobdella robusta]ESN97059.1 hypothetical protein HELRODRAFT_178508 [Helobdella robusta]